ncbi:hypothetical protein K2173_018387 [Erythroxylum novogranatense]|uniref:Cytochrome P450 n=1 Tax=Erythroxylum novogranatense TaxID=1862640 RepID=A0AAV8UCX5_9ROSI|nr:hypothetical protein K2173_018387 [Erythroxylum novogranatense]
MEDFLSHILAISGALLLVILYNLRRARGWRYRNNGLTAPEPSGALPILGHLHLLGAQKTLARTLAAMADKHGPIFRIWLGKNPAVVISSSEIIKECFTTYDKILASRPKSSHGECLSYNYAAFGFASYGTYWRNMRKLVTIQLLSGHRLKELRHVRVSEVNTFVKDLYSLCKISKHHSITTVVISEWLERLTLNMITRMIAGKKYYFSSPDAENQEEGKRIGKLIKEYMYVSGTLVPSDLIPFLGWLNYFPGPVKTMKRLSRELDSVMENWIEDHKLKKMKMEPNNVQDFIDVMLSAMDDDSICGHTRENVIKGTSTTLIIAGADTTAIASTWILSNLLNNRNTLERAQEELDQKVGRERWVEESDIGNLAYLQAIIKETLRLYPPGPLGVPHEATEDCCIAGYHIPKGTRLLVNFWKLHRDPEVWSNPDEFMPERFLTMQSKVDVLGQNFELLPFGSGRRSCPGMTFALQAIPLTLAMLLQGFDVTPPSNVPVDMSEGAGITLSKATPLQVQITPRLNPHLYEL